MSHGGLWQASGIEAPVRDGSCPAPKILFVGEAVSLAHVGRPAMLARWAKEAGYEAVFACGARYAHVAHGEGLDPLLLETIAPEAFYGRLETGRFFYTQSELLGYVEAERALLRRVRPALVVADFRLSLAVSCEREGVPLLSITQAHWCPAAADGVPAPLHWPSRYVPRALRHALFACGRAIAYRTFAAPLDAVRKAHGLRARRDFRLHYTAGAHCAYLDLPAFATPRRLPRGHFYLGPLYWAPRGAPASEVETNRPLAYVSMGSSGDEGLLPAVLKALDAQGFDAAVTGVCKLRAQAPNARFLGTVDPSAVLARAALCVCHAGHGTVYQSLAAGVPVLCLPSNPDQGLVARCVVRCAAGARLDADACTPARTLAAVTEASSQRCRDAARGLGDAIRRWDTRAHWIEWLTATLPLPAHRIATGARAEALAAN